MAGNGRKGDWGRGSREKWRQLRKSVVSKGSHNATETPVTATARELKNRAARDSILTSLLFRTVIPLSLSTNF